MWAQGLEEKIKSDTVVDKGGWVVQTTDEGNRVHGGERVKRR